MAMNICFSSSTLVISADLIVNLHLMERVIYLVLVSSFVPPFTVRVLVLSSIILLPGCVTINDGGLVNKWSNFVITLTRNNSFKKRHSCVFVFTRTVLRLTSYLGCVNVLSRPYHHPYDLKVQRKKVFKDIFKP